MTSWQPILRRGVLDVGAYSPGVSAAEIKTRYGIRGVVRLNWNENLYGALPVEKWMRDAKLEEIEEGTSDIQRLVISRAVLR
jgi:alkylation response protein AidB-like acyl-CoA dehydrogenase